MPLFKIRSSYKPTAEVNEFVGEKGNLFYSEEDRTIRASDGLTLGGIVVAGADNRLSGPRPFGVYTEVYALEGTSFTFLFSAYGVENLISFDLLDQNNQVVEASYNVYNDRIFIDSNIELINHLLRIVHAK